ncbi:MAG TPA: hypothetical protein VF517_16845 [Thermoleophilaceae bacterium]|jgi:hypothetical protein
MTERPVEGINITEVGDRVVIEVDNGRWEGTAAQAEQLLTRLHYVLARARPDTNIASIFLNGELWGGKFTETDSQAAIRKMRHTIDQLADYVASLESGAGGTQT